MKKMLIVAAVAFLLCGAALLPRADAPVKTESLTAVAATADASADDAVVVAAGQNVSVPALGKCSPVAGFYENPDPRRKIRNLPLNHKIGYRGSINSQWARVEDYSSPSEGHWGFMRRECVGSFNSW